MLSQLQADLAQAHVELLSAQADRIICGAAFNKSEVILTEACRKRYLADRALQAVLLKQQPEFEI